MMGAIPTEDKEGKFAMWFPQANKDPKELERHRKLFILYLIGQNDSTEEQMRTNNIAMDLQI
eukprot:15358252-Ditylum_brightwellii.AAC.1